MQVVRRSIALILVSLTAIGCTSGEKAPEPSISNGEARTAETSGVDPGFAQDVRDEVLVAPYNDLDAVAALLREHHAEIGGVIVEPLQRVIPPAPGFLAGLRALTTQYGTPLIFDEVVTGFRFAYGGAQELYGVTPDICTLGKVIGGGLPLAAIAGRADIMALMANAYASYAMIWHHRYASMFDLLLEAEVLCKTTGVPAEAVCGRALFNVAAMGKMR